jgi:molybdopterin-containing oxidoreductase family iron-sulfur binding subunit
MRELFACAVVLGLVVAFAGCATDPRNSAASDLQMQGGGQDPSGTVYVQLEEDKVLAKKPLAGPDPRKVFPSNDEHSWSPPWRMPQSKEDWKRGVGIQPRGVVSKCNFCYHRISKARPGKANFDPSDPGQREYTPACVVTCAPSARYFGDLDNPDSEVSKMIANKGGVRLLDQLGNKPQVYYLTGSGGAVPSNRAIKKT